MSTSAVRGPQDIVGQIPPITGPTPYVGGPAALVDSNEDLSPSLVWAGWGLRDIDYQPRSGAGALVAGGYANQDVGFYGLEPFVIDQVPSTAAINNIAVAANAASGVAMVLVSATGAGITYMAAAQTILPTGLVVPLHALAIDTQPAWIGAGFSGGLQWLDPTHSLSRAVSITGVSGGAGGHFIVSGFDYRGVPMSENINAAAGVATTNGKKAFKFITSVVPQFSDAHTYSVGTADIFGLSLRVDRFAYVEITWNDANITANTGFVAADATSPATQTTGDVRGTYAVQSASDGTKRLQVQITPRIGNLVGATFAAAHLGLFGVVQR